MIIKRNKQKKPEAPVQEVQENVVPKKELQEDTSDLFAGFNFDEIEFNQRAERRRGDRRRGYRRIDERNTITRAQAEAISIKETAAKEGFEKGLEEAETAIFELKDSMKEFFDYKETIYNELSEHVLDIALEVAEKIIKREVEIDETILESIVKDALKNLAKDENKIILKVNPTDVEYMKEVVPELLSSGQIEAKIFVTGDKDIEEGSAVIETSNGIIDANIRTQLEIIKEAFKQI